MKRYRLRTLMLGVAVVGLILGLVAQHARHVRTQLAMERLAAEARAERARCQAEVLQMRATVAVQEGQVQVLKQQLADLQGPAKAAPPSPPAGTGEVTQAGNEPGASR